MIGAIVSKILIKNAFRDLSNRNIDKFLSPWSENAVFHYPGNANASGTFFGIKTIRAWFTRMLDQYPEIDFDVRRVCVQNIFDLIGSNYVIAEWNIKLKRNDGAEFENNGITTINLKFGKAIEVRDFIFDLDKVKDAWSTAPKELAI